MYAEMNTCTRVDLSVVESTAIESTAIESAAAVWAVVNTALNGPATPERKTELLAARARLLGLIREAGLTEADLLRHLREIYGRGRPPDAGGLLQLVPH